MRHDCAGIWVLALAALLLLLPSGLAVAAGASEPGETSESQTVRVLVAYYSLHGNTERFAQSVAEGAKQVPGTVVTIKKTKDVSKEDLHRRRNCPGIGHLLRQYSRQDEGRYRRLELEVEGRLHRQGGRRVQHGRRPDRRQGVCSDLPLAFHDQQPDGGGRSPLSRCGSGGLGDSSDTINRFAEPAVSTKAVTGFVVEYLPLLVVGFFDSVNDGQMRDVPFAIHLEG